MVDTPLSLSVDSPISFSPTPRLQPSQSPGLHLDEIDEVLPSPVPDFIDPCLDWIPEANIGPRVIEENYKMSKLLGEGSSGAVFLGTSKTDGSKVAIKKMKKTAVSAADFNMEATFLFNIQCKGVIKFVNAAMDKDNYYLIMEHAKYGDLMDVLLRNGGRFSEKFAAAIIRRLLRTISYLHGNDIVHRDIKPDNIVFRDKSGHPVLVDFAMATKVPKDGKLIVNQLCGTPFYAAPERWAPHTADSLKAGDMFSIGVMAYGMVLGFLPWADGSMKKTKRSILKDEVRFYESKFKTSPEFRDFVSSLLEKDYSKRLPVDEALKHPWINPRVSST